MSDEEIPPAQYLTSVQVCSISFHMLDRIRLMGLPPDMISLIRNAISRSWGTIQSERYHYGNHEFKLKGYPWSGKGEDAITSRRLLVAILTTMAQHGWNLLQAVDVSQKRNFDDDALFFEKGIPEPDAHLFAVTFNDRDKIRLIDAPEVFTCVRDAIQSHWPQGVKNERNYYGSMELQLSGSPWFPGGSDTGSERVLLCQIIANVRSKGYKLYGSVDMTKENKEKDLCSWIFRRVGHSWI